MKGTVGRLIAGFIAGALAVLSIYQVMFLILNMAGWVANAPWRMNPVPPYGVPTLINQLFWGGLWGAGFGLLYEKIPGTTLAKGLIFGMLGPMLLGSWLIVATLKGQPMFGGAFAKGFDILRLRNGFLLNGIAFGIGIGLLYPMLSRFVGSRHRA